MAQGFFQRDGPSFPWGYTAPGTTASVVFLWAPITIRYSLSDPDAIVPGDDIVPLGTLARQVVDPATYAGTLGPDIGAASFDALHEKWALLTYAGSRKLFVIPQSHVADLDAWLTQPDKLIGPTLIPAPYGVDEKSWVILGQILCTHLIDHEET
jgi:hypothetical protein